MAHEWKPGDVALVRLATRPKAEPAIYDGDAWHVRKGATADPIEEPRPLVVIDPEDREQVERLTSELLARHQAQHDTAWCYSGTCAADRTEAALRSLIAPPKPDEPMGLGAVVEDTHDNKWVRVYEGVGEGPAWYCDVPIGYRNSDRDAQDRKWADIAAVKILSEGVQ